MINDIANILKECICKLPFADKVGGLVEVAKVKDKKIPVTCDYCYDKCIGNETYLEMIPEAHLKSLFYFENDNGVKNVLQRGCCTNIYETDLRLVGWVNLKKLGVKDCFATTQIIQTIIKQIQCNDCVELKQPYSRINIVDVSVLNKNPNIFLKHNFKDNFRFSPYDYFALNIKVQFILNADCIIDFEPQTPIDC